MSSEPQFTWCDLSTFRPEVTQPFYGTVLDWTFDGPADGYGPDSVFARSGRDAVAAIYPMPQKFRDINMPSFWMSYVTVSELGEALEHVAATGGRVELADEHFALIRDPLGAGFTLFRDPGTGPAARYCAHGQRAGHGYFCSDFSAVRDFYRTLFGWEFEGSALDTAVIRTKDGASVASALQLPEQVRGKEQYWAIRFAVDDLVGAADRARDAGGALVTMTDLPEGPAALIRDPDGAACFLTEATAG